MRCAGADQLVGGSGVGASDRIDRLMLSGKAAKGGATGEGRRSGHQAMHVRDGSCRWIIFLVRAASLQRFGPYGLLRGG